jgi:hypothetical protein
VLTEARALVAGRVFGEGFAADHATPPLVSGRHARGLLR